MECPFTAVSIALGVFYLFVLGLVLRYFASLLHRDKRSAQKCFLTLVVVTLLLRLVYFFSWPYFGRWCHPKPVTHHFHWTDLFGTLPVPFFLSAFSVLTYTFSRIYHTVLRGSAAHARAHRTYVVGVSVLMAGSFATVALALTDASETTGRVLLWYTVGATFCVALAFLVYGLLLHADVACILVETRRQNPELPPQPNSMRRIAIVATLCMGCFLVRATMLPLSEREFGFTWWVGLAYFSLSEVAPLLLMLSVFDSQATSGADTRSRYRPQEPLLSRP